MVLLSSVVPRFVVRTFALWQLLVAVLSGGSTVRSAWLALRERHGLSVRSGYRLWRKMTDMLSPWRISLTTMKPPPSCDRPEPMAQVVAHFAVVFPSARDLMAAFGQQFQTSILGGGP